MSHNIDPGNQAVQTVTATICRNSEEQMGNLAPERRMETNIYSTRVQAPTISHPGAAAHSTHDAVDRIDEVTAPNPVSGRAVSEDSARLMKAKRSILVSTMNVRTLRKESKRFELANPLDEFPINILGIVDHQIVHDEEVRYEQLNKCTMITTSAWQNSNGAASGGVGLMINNYAKNHHLLKTTKGYSLRASMVTRQLPSSFTTHLSRGVQMPRAITKTCLAQSMRSLSIMLSW